MVGRKRKCEVDIKRDDAGGTHVGGIKMCEKRQIVRVEEVFIKDGRVLKSRKTRLWLEKVGSKDGEGGGSVYRPAFMASPHLMVGRHPSSSPSQREFHAFHLGVRSERCFFFFLSGGVFVPPRVGDPLVVLFNMQPPQVRVAASKSSFCLRHERYLEHSR